MTKMRNVALSALGLLMISAGAASADGYRHGWGSGWGWGNWNGYGRNATTGRTIDQRQENQSDRIQRGLRDGSLTHSEAARLRQEQARIADMERRAKSDGHYSYTERQRITDAQRRANWHIWSERHDGQNRGWRW